MTSPEETPPVAPEDPQPEGLNDESVPPSPSPPAASSARGNVQDAHEIPTAAAIDKMGEVGGKSLATFLYIHPFTRFFSHLADRHLQEHAPEARVRMYRERSRRFWAFCVFCDYVLLVAVVAVLLGASAVALYKTLWLPTMPGAGGG